MYIRNWVELKWWLFTPDSLDFLSSIALRWFSKHGCQCLVHRDEDPDIALEAVYNRIQNSFCSGTMLYASKNSMFHIQFLLFYYIFPLQAACTVGYPSLQNPRTFSFPLCPSHLCLISLWHLFMPCVPDPPDRLSLKHHSHHWSISYSCVGISPWSPHTLGDSFGSQVFIPRENIP